MNYDLSLFPILQKGINWGIVEGCFTSEIEKDESLISNISIIPTVGNHYVVMQLEDSRWELVGGTLEPGEHYMDALRREVMEELGAVLVSYQEIGSFRCHSSAFTPYRAHIPHPDFVRLVGYGEVQVIGRPLNPLDGEQVMVVEAVSIQEAISRFQAISRFDIAELYKLAHYVRTGQLIEGSLNK